MGDRSELTRKGLGVFASLSLNSGIGLVSILVMATVGFGVAFAMVQLIALIARANAHNSLIAELRQTSGLLQDVIDCSGTLRSLMINSGDTAHDLKNLVPESALTTFCTSDVNTILDPAKLHIKNRAGADLGSFTATTSVTQIGKWSFKAGCVYDGVIGSGTVRRCLTVHAALLGSATTFRKDPLNQRELVWTAIRHLPFCCVVPD